MSANIRGNRLGLLSESVPSGDGWRGWLTQIAHAVNFLLGRVPALNLTVGDAAYTVSPSDQIVGTSTAFTAARVWTLYPAQSVDAGTELSIVDFGAAITTTNTLTIAPGGSDTIDGSATSLVLVEARGGATLVSDGASNWGIKWLRGARATYQATPADPAATASLTGVMMGLAGSITPRGTGVILFLASGSAFNTVSTDGVAAQLRYGTGTAPTNGAALTGTAAGAKPTLTTGGAGNGFALNAIITGLTRGTTYWLDIAANATVGGTAQLSLLSLSATELTP